jgi:hypothetical protein
VQERQVPDVQYPVLLQFSVVCVQLQSWHVLFASHFFVQVKGNFVAVFPKQKFCGQFFVPQFVPNGHVFGQSLSSQKTHPVGQHESLFAHNNLVVCLQLAVHVPAFMQVSVVHGLASAQSKSELHMGCMQEFKQQAFPFVHPQSCAQFEQFSPIAHIPSPHGSWQLGDHKTFVVCVH